MFFEKEEEEEEKEAENENEKEKEKEKRNDYRCLLHKSEDARESRDKINNFTAIDTRVRK